MPVILTFSDRQLKLRTAGMGEDIAHLGRRLPVRLSIGVWGGLGNWVPRWWW